MYSIYSTEGIILKSAPSGEADKSYTILTRQFGMIAAEAQGVRKLHSKLRYSLQDLSLVQLSLVRGKGGKWRIVSVALKKNIFADLRGNSGIIALTGRIASLLLRLLPSEEKDDGLFEIFLGGLMYLANNKPEGKNLQNIECVIVLRLLRVLGYLGDLSDLNFFVETSAFDAHLILEMERFRQKALVEINKSLSASNL